jgi:hypothetical protein
MGFFKFIKNWLATKSRLDKTLIGSGIIAGIFVIAFFAWWWGENQFEIISSGEGEEIVSGVSFITGLPCVNADLRPMAVMLAADTEARPLSALSQADIVFEMPVTPNKMPRYMAIFQCNQPQEVGSIRSAREDFVPLAAGFDAIYIHWGGEHDVLTKLNNHIIDNIDALKFDGTVFYRKKNRPMPHNGFTSYANLKEKAEDFEYSFKNTFSGYPHGQVRDRSLSNLAPEIAIDYEYPQNVRWVYDEASKTYKRFRGGQPEIDAATGEQVAVSVVVVMETESNILNIDYIRVKTQGTGAARFYQEGVLMSGTWKKDPGQFKSKLFFYDTQGPEMKFIPGKIWGNIDTSPK